MTVRPRLLVVNADDLGYDPEIDRGILESHRRGVVTSATAMVDTPFAARALAAAPPSLDLGLHAVIPRDLEPERVAAELLRQIGRFQDLARRRPSHLDSHRHAHAGKGALEAFAEVASAEGLPLRALDEPMRRALRARGVATADHFLGDGALRPCWTLERLVAVLAALPMGTTELMCHPGYRPAQARTSFGAEREIELAALCHPAAREALARSGAALTCWASSARRP